MDFRKKLLGFAGLAMVSATVAFGQTTCTNLVAPGGPSFIRAEGQTELLPGLTLACTGVAGSSLNLTIFLTPAVPVTSKVLSGSTTEAAAVANGGGGSVNGTIVGSSIVFNNITLTAATTLVVVTNLRVNATGIPSTPGMPPVAISAQAFVGGTLVTPGANTNTNPNVAFVQSGLGVSKVTKDFANANSGVNTGTFGVCGSLAAQTTSTPAAPIYQFYVQVNEGFQNAFKTMADESSQTPAVVSGVSNVANSGTRVKLVFTNVPVGLQIYLPITVGAGNGSAGSADGATLTLTSSETGGFAAVPAITGQSNISSLAPSAQVTLSGTTATAVYEVTTDNLTAVDLYSIPVAMIAATDTLAAQTAAMTLTTSFAPITAITTVPSFGGTTPASINTISFAVCQTNLLFPFVTNAGGFETGIAIANTSKDPFTTGNPGPAKPQAGTCVLNFYGTGGTNPTAVTAPNPNEGAGMPYAAGEAYAFTLTNALAATAGNPATFQGYVIAQCNFNYAHGFAYITYAFPGTSSDTMGYLAVVLNRGGQSLVADSAGN
jgi:hypothetical protein